MASLQFVPLYMYQREHLEFILDYVNTDDRWVKFEACFSHLFPDLPRDKSLFLNCISKGGCAYYYHILSNLRETQGLEFLANCPKAYPSLFRHVFFNIDNGQPVILSKGALWFQSKNDCLQSAKKYKPSLDYPESHGSCVILSVENCHLHYPDTSHPINSDDPTTFCTQCDSFDKLHVGNNTIIKMPWVINYDHHHTIPLYIYCIQNSDVWFYSWSKNIQAAYDAYYHH